MDYAVAVSEDIEGAVEYLALLQLEVEEYKHLVD